MVLQHEKEVVLQGVDKMKIEENAKAELSYLKKEIEEKKEKLKKMENRYDVYNNLLKNMSNLHAYKVRELNDVEEKLAVFYKKLQEKEFELNDLNYLIEKAKSRLEKIEERKEFV